MSDPDYMELTCNVLYFNFLKMKHSDAFLCTSIQWFDTISEWLQRLGSPCLNQRWISCGKRMCNKVTAGYEITMRRTILVLQPYLWQAVGFVPVSLSWKRENVYVCVLQLLNMSWQSLFAGGHIKCLAGIAAPWVCEHVRFLWMRLCTRDHPVWPKPFGFHSRECLFVRLFSHVPPPLTLTHVRFSWRACLGIKSRVMAAFALN